MNPSFFAFQRAYCKLALNALMGVSHVPKPKRDPNTGPAFATTEGAYPRSDIIMMAEAEQKERETQKYLDDLAARHQKWAEEHPLPSQEGPKPSEDAVKLQHLSDTGRIHTRTRLTLDKATGRAPAKPSTRKPREDGNFL